MTCGVTGFKTKKQLKAAIGTDMETHVVETSFFGPEWQRDGVTTVCGPDVYNNRRWFARIQCEDGKLTKVIE